MVAECEGEHDSVMALHPTLTSVLLDCINIMDSGSATTLAGKDDAAAWIRAGVATSVSPRATSVQHIRGIGAIPASERLIMMIAVGLPLESHFRAARSPRRLTTEVLQMHGG